MPLTKLSHWIRQLPNLLAQRSLMECINPVADRLICTMLTPPALVIKAAAGVLVKTGAAISLLLVQGKLAQIAAATDMPALAGTVVNATFNTFSFFQDAAGVRTSAMGTPAATLANVEMAPVPEGQTMIGFIVVNPTGTGNFVGGTTALDDVTVVPGVIYSGPTGAYHPHIRL